MKNKYIVVGSGFAGSVIAERIANKLNQKVLVIDKRNHIGGTSYSHRDKNTGIDIHDYGSHIFHTNDKKIWDYINNFSSFNMYRHKVMLNTHGNITIMPINLKTISDIYKLDMSIEEAKRLVESDKYQMKNDNLEEKAISLIGEKLYEYCIKGYTTKQWNRYPKELPSSIITRLPIRYNYNFNYFNDRYQGIPENGYDKLIENMLNSKNIEIKLNTSYNDIKNEIDNNTVVFYSGMIDEFCDYKFGELEWRSLRFEFESLDIDDYQGNSVINYNDLKYPFTRIHEFKHYQTERNEIFNIGKTIICREYPYDWNKDREAYYPIESDKNKQLLSKYQEYVKNNFPNIIFIGRLGKYKYFNMDSVIKDTLEIFNYTCQSNSNM